MNDVIIKGGTKNGDLGLFSRQNWDVKGREEDPEIGKICWVTSSMDHPT